MPDKREIVHIQLDSGNYIFSCVYVYFELDKIFDIPYSIYIFLWSS